MTPYDELRIRLAATRERPSLGAYDYLCEDAIRAVGRLVHPARSAHDDPAGDNAPLTSRGQSGPDGPTAGGG